MNLNFLASLILAFCIMLGGQRLLAHGEDQLGPHGGHIRMPGAFHTELSISGPGAFTVHLLDINFKNPSVKSSNLSAYTVDGPKTVNYQCIKVGSAFNCSGPKLPSKGSLILKASREGAQGNEATYQLPLKKLAPAKDEHHMNH